MGCGSDDGTGEREGEIHTRGTDSGVERTTQHGQHVHRMNDRDHLRRKLHRHQPPSDSGRGADNISAQCEHLVEYRLEATGMHGPIPRSFRHRVVTFNLRNDVAQSRVRRSRLIEVHDHIAEDPVDGNPSDTVDAGQLVFQCFDVFGRSIDVVDTARLDMGPALADPRLAADDLVPDRMQGVRRKRCGEPDASCDPEHLIAPSGRVLVGYP